jgi:hypothetical protein
MSRYPERSQFNYTASRTGRVQSQYPNRSNVPAHGSRRSRVPGSATKPPKIPKSGKECRRMIKAACHRLSVILKIKASTILKSEEPFVLVMDKIKPGRNSERGPALSLARKIVRLRKWESAKRDGKPKPV